jgi:hypothetical protein
MKAKRGNEAGFLIPREDKIDIKHYMMIGCITKHQDKIKKVENKKKFLSIRMLMIKLGFFKRIERR